MLRFQKEALCPAESTDLIFVFPLDAAGHLPYVYRPGLRIIGSELICGVIQICNSSELFRLREMKEGKPIINSKTADCGC